VFVATDPVWRAYSARPDPLAGFKEPLCGREGRPGWRAGDKGNAKRRGGWTLPLKTLRAVSHPSTLSGMVM